MCLVIDNRKKAPKKPFEVYKKLRFWCGEITTPIQRTLVHEGEFLATGTLKKRKLFPNWMYDSGKRRHHAIDRGAIHAYTDFKFAESRCGRNEEFILKVLVFPEDWIAWGTKSDVAVKRLLIPHGSLKIVPEIIKLGIEGRKIKGVKKKIKTLLDELQYLYSQLG